jgi:nucleoside-diphosphate-sugar epimerase
MKESHSRFLHKPVTTLTGDFEERQENSIFLRKNTKQMKVLFIGANGVVGGQVIPKLSNDFDLTLTAFGGGNVADKQVIDLDVTDWDATFKAFEGQNYDAVVNCATASHLDVESEDPQWLRQYFEQCIDVNARGAFHVFEAAALCGVERCIYISSMTTIMGLPKYEYADRDAAPRPVSLYSATKLFGEQLGHIYAHRSEDPLKVLCLRLGQPYPSFTKIDQTWAESDFSCSLMVHSEDITEAISRALKTDVCYGVYPILSKANTSWVDTSRISEIGYQPKWHFSLNGMEKIDS